MSNVSRRHFLQASGTAAAGLAVGATALPTRHIAAQAAPMIGQLVSIRRGPVTLHTYVAPDGSVSVTTHIIETANALVVIDAQFAQTFAGEAAAVVASLGKPVAKHILSHAHPDHFAGANQFVDSPFVSTATIAAEVQAYIDNGSLAALVGFLGEAEAPTVENARVPEGSISAGEEVIDGVTFTYELQLNAEATEQLVIGIPEARALIVQDLIYNSNHFFPGLDRDNWIAALEALQARTEYDTFLVGHGLPASRGVLDTALSYLRFVQETTATAATADDIIAAVQTQYPNYTGTGILGFWNQFFQPS